MSPWPRESIADQYGPTQAAVAALEWARFRAQAGQMAQAVAQLTDTMPEVRRTLPRGNDFLWYPLTAALRILLSAGRFQEAERYAKESLEVVDQVGAASPFSSNMNQFFPERQVHRFRSSATY